MAKVKLDNGQISYKAEEFVSYSIYRAHQSDEPWDAKNYVCVELDPVFIWMTKSEQEELSKITDTDEIDKYVNELNVLAIWKDDFDNWRQGREENN